MRAFCLAALALIGTVGVVSANDSTAELATGGLVYVETNDVEMRSEDLFISLDQIRVRYEFMNTSDHDVTSLVAFPMPDIKGDIDFMVAVPVEDPENFLGFKTLVDGKPVATRVQQRASALGIDQTQLLQGLGVPLAPQIDATRAALDKLPPDEWNELLRLGLTAIDEYDAGQGWEKHLAPMWVLSTAYYWEQTFPAGESVIVEHSYTPSVGQTAGISFGYPESRSEGWFKAYRQRFCIDDDFLTTVDKARARTGGDAYVENRIDYILKTAENWGGPIKKFHLTIDKGAPDNLVSFCGEGVKKTGPTRFEISKTDYEPADDLSVLILTAIPKE